jgi:hypothetical protein
VAQSRDVRFRYSDLKEAAFSGAAVLWELDGLELIEAAGKSGVLTF